MHTLLYMRVKSQQEDVWERTSSIKHAWEHSRTIPFFFTSSYIRKLCKKAMHMRVCFWLSGVPLERQLCIAYNWIENGIAKFAIVLSSSSSSSSFHIDTNSKPSHLHDTHNFIEYVFETIWYCFEIFILSMIYFVCFTDRACTKLFASATEYHKSVCWHITRNLFRFFGSILLKEKKMQKMEIWSSINLQMANGSRLSSCLLRIGVYIIYII